MLDLRPDTDRKLEILDAVLSYAYSNMEDIIEAQELRVDGYFAERVIEELRNQIHAIQAEREKARREREAQRKGTT